MIAEELQRIYDSGINIRIESLWDGGWRAAVGDEMNGLHWFTGSIATAAGSTN
jgi:hypothetical protein